MKKFVLSYAETFFESYDVYNYAIGAYNSLKEAHDAMIEDIIDEYNEANDIDENDRSYDPNEDWTISDKNAELHSEFEAKRYSIDEIEF